MTATFPSLRAALFVPMPEQHHSDEKRIFDFFDVNGRGDG